MKLLSNKAWFVLVGFFVAVPGLNFKGISVSYLLVFVGGLSFILNKSKEWYYNYLLASTILVVLAYHAFFPIEESYWVDRISTRYFVAPTKFAESFFSQNFVIALKLFISTICLSQVFALARKYNLSAFLGNGFLLGALTSAIFSFFGIRQGDTGYLISTGLASRSTTFGLICCIGILITLSNNDLSFIFKFLIHGIFLTAVLLSGSRGALLLAFLILFTYIFSRITAAGRTILVLSSTFLILVTVLFQNILQDRFNLTTFLNVRVFSGGNSIARSDLYRAKLREQALGDFTQNPFFGAGFRTLTSGHLVPLQLLAAGGIILFLGYSIFIYSAFKRLATYETNPIIVAQIVFLIGSFLSQNQIDVPFIYFTLFLFGHKSINQKEKLSLYD